MPGSLMASCWFQSRVESEADVTQDPAVTPAPPAKTKSDDGLEDDDDDDDLEDEIGRDLDQLKLDDIDTTDVALEDEDLLDDE